MLADNWQNWWKMYSVQLMLLLAAFQGVWATQPELITALMPAAWVPRVTAVMALGAALLRQIKQPAVSGP